MTKYLIFDSGVLINLAQSCLLSVFRELKEKFHGEFIIPPAVKYETIDHPLKIKRFGWGAMRIQALLDDEVIKLPETINLVTGDELNKKTEEVMNNANGSFLAAGKEIHIIERGESECLALSLLLNERKIDNAVVIDERTARMLCENPEMLKELMSEKLETKVELMSEKLEQFKKINVLRSPELIYIAHKDGLIDSDIKKFEAMLYALKFGGCSISEKEIQAIKKM